MNIYYDFSQFLNYSCKIYLEANLGLRKGCVNSLKKSAAISSFFDSAERKKTKKIFLHHPKLTYEIIVQIGHEQV